MALTAAQVEEILGYSPKAGVAAVTDLTCPAKADVPAASYFVCQGPSAKYAFWFDTTGTDVAPTVAGHTLEKVDISGDTTAATVATTLAGVVGGLADFSASATDAVVTVTNASASAFGWSDAGASGVTATVVTVGYGPDAMYVIPLTSTDLVAIEDVTVDGNPGQPLSPHVDYFGYVMGLAATYPSDTLPPVGTDEYSLGTPAVITGLKVADDFTSAGCTLTASISDNVMTVTVAAGTVRVGQKISGTGVAKGTVVTGKDSGTGGTGTYFVSVDQEVASTTITGDNQSVIVMGDSLALTTFALTDITGLVDAYTAA